MDTYQSDVYIYNAPIVLNTFSSGDEEGCQLVYTEMRSRVFTLLRLRLQKPPRSPEQPLRGVVQDRALPSLKQLWAAWQGIEYVS